LGLFCCSIAFSQSLTPELLTSGGDHFTGTDAQLSWSVGEMIIDTYDNGSNQLTQGFHQTNLVITSVNDLAENIEIAVFPNPTSDQLNIEYSNSTQNLTLNLYDALGTQLLSEQVLMNAQFDNKSIDLSGLAANTYFLHIANEKNESIKVFKILKI